MLFVFMGQKAKLWPWVLDWPKWLSISPSNGSCGVAKDKTGNTYGHKPSEFALFPQQGMDLPDPCLMLTWHWEYEYDIEYIKIISTYTYGLYMHSLKWFKHAPIGRNHSFGVPRQKPGKFSRVDIQHKDSILRGEFLGSESCDDERWFKRLGKLEIWSVFGIKFWKIDSMSQWFLIYPDWTWIVWHCLLFVCLLA